MENKQDKSKGNDKGNNKGNDKGNEKATESETKFCVLCNETKDICNFAKGRSQCKPCFRLRAKTNAMAKAKENALERKVCIECKETKDICNFEVGRNQCKQCKRLKVKTNAMAAAKEKANNDTVEVETKTCSECGETKEISEFELHRKQCMSCRQQKRNASMTKRVENSLAGVIEANVIKLPNGRVHIGNSLPVECKECKCPFDADTFCYRSERKHYDAKCRKCFSATKYYQAYREKKRAADEPADLEHNAKMYC